MDSEATLLLHDTVPFARVLGLEVVQSTPEVFRVRASWSAERCGAGGVMNGGFLMALGDISGSACAYLNLPQGAVGTTTLESKTNLLRPVSGGTVETISRPLHLGRSTQVVETDILDESGRRVARALQTMSVIRSSP